MAAPVPEIINNIFYRTELEKRAAQSRAAQSRAHVFGWVPNIIGITFFCMTLYIYIYI
jgi:hypothetical protein